MRHMSTHGRVDSWTSRFMDESARRAATDMSWPVTRSDSVDARSGAGRPSVSCVELFRTKSVEAIQQHGEEGNEDGGVGSLRKRLSARHLIGFGIGVVIGTGIFTLTGIQAKNTAGPA